MAVTDGTWRWCLLVVILAAFLSTCRGVAPLPPPNCPDIPVVPGAALSGRCVNATFGEACTIRCDDYQATRVCRGDGTWTNDPGVTCPGKTILQDEQLLNGIQSCRRTQCCGWTPPILLHSMEPVQTRGMVSTTQPTPHDTCIYVMCGHSNALRLELGKAAGIVAGRKRACVRQSDWSIRVQ